MPKETFRILKNTRVCGRKKNISELKASGLRDSKRSAKGKPDSKNRKPVRKSGGKKIETSSTKMRKNKKPKT